MTYCVGLLLDDGLVMAADTRTNAGVDHIGTFRKMSVFEKMKRPYFRFIDKEESDELPEGQTLGEDYYFCNKMREAGIRMWCDIDLSYQVGHVGQWVFTPGQSTCALPFGPAAPPPPVEQPKAAAEAA